MCIKARERGPLIPFGHRKNIPARHEVSGWPKFTRVRRKGHWKSNPEAIGKQSGLELSLIYFPAKSRGVALGKIKSSPIHQDERRNNLWEIKSDTSPFQ